MKYTLETHGTPSTFEEFCEEHRLSVTVHERQRGRYGPEFLAKDRYYATLEPHVEEMINGMLGPPYGNGDTPEDAIMNMVNKVRGCRLVVGAYTKERREFVAPNDWREE